MPQPHMQTQRHPSAVVSVCLPARNEEATVGRIVERIGRLPGVDEILVVDDGSTDRTRCVATAAGAVVIPTESAGGKGEALWTAVGAAKGDILAFCDADLLDFDPSWVTRMIDPLLASDRADFVKARYGRDGEGGRVTELVAKPAISLLLPELARFAQPLAGEFAARRAVLEQVAFVQDFGVDLALLHDVVHLVGPERVVEVDLGVKRHRNRPLADLREQARQVLRAALHRAGVAGVPEPPTRPPLR